MRGGKELPLKGIVDDAIALGGCDTLRQVLVFQRTATPVNMQAGRDVWLHDALQGQPTQCPAEAVDAEHPLFILYTSGSTGKPKGVQHSTAGYLLWTKLTMQWTFDIQCTRHLFGAPPTSAGLRAIATWPTARWRLGQPKLFLRAYPPTPMPRAFGK